MKSLKLLSTAAAVAGVRIGLADIREWAQPISGAWNVAANWTPDDIPDSPREDARIAVPGSYAVELDRSALLAGLEIANPDAVMNINAGSALYLASTSAVTLTIRSPLIINPTGENRVTELAFCAHYFNGYTYLNGDGAIRLNANPDNLDSAKLGQLCEAIS